MRLSFNVTGDSRKAIVTAIEKGTDNDKYAFRCLLLRLTTQVPYTIEIVSNGASAKCREVSVKNHRIILRRPRTEINKDNVLILQLLDLLKDFEKYVDVDVYISFFPDRVFKYIYKMRLYNAFR